MKTKVFKSGNSLAVRLPRGFELPCGEVNIRREGRRVVIEEATPEAWPAGFFEEIRIDREDFSRGNPIYREKPL
jgi:virulence-associated protein VagC